MSDTEHPCEQSSSQLDIQFWYRRVYALCQSRLISTTDAEDATQETFVRALSRMHELRSQDALGGWLRQISQNVCVDIIRRQSVRATERLEINEIARIENETAIDRESRDHIVQLIHSLPETLRETILLHYYDEMTYDQMASWLNVARSTVNERLSKARQLLKQQLMTENTP